MKRSLTLLACCLIGSVQFAQVEAGLISHYRFNGNAVDIVGGNNGIVSGATLTTDRFGISNAAYHFDPDSDQYIEIPFNSDFTPGSNPMSISLWFRDSPTNTAPATGTLLSWFRCGANPTCGASDEAYYKISLTDDSYVNLFVRDDADNASNITDSTSRDNGNWHHVLMVFDPTMDVIEHYINDVQVHSEPMVLSALTDGGVAIPLSFGRTYRTGWGDPVGYFSGNIDDIRIYGRALSALEVDSLYHEGGFVGIADQEAAIDISVFPNPTQGIVSFNNEIGTKMDLTLFNTVGKVIKRSTLYNGNNTLDLSDLPNNIYLYRITNKEGLVLRTGRLIKM